MLAETMSKGGEDASVAIRRRARGTVQRRRALLVVALAALAAILLFVPEQASSPSGVIGVASGIVVPSGVTPPNPGYSPGVAVSGVRCGPGVRQVAWSAYAPPCEPAWHGNNGGATSRGVTSKTITISYRAASTAQLADLYAIVPPGVIGTNQEEIDTLNTYINTFNKYYELYGRKVVLVPYQGKGDFISEDLGQDQAQAQEDAVTVATSLKAFADMSLIDSSAVYSSDLAAQHVVTSSLYENASSWYQQYAPWEYTPGPNCTKSAAATGAILGKQLGGLRAIYAGSSALRAKTRTYGIIYPQNPQAATCMQEDVAALAKYGQTVKEEVGVKFSLAQLVASSQNAVAQMKAAGVTTVIMSSADPITPTFMMQAANSENYHPEWWFQSYFSGGETNTDTLTRLFPFNQATHIIGVGNQAQPLKDQEAIKAYYLGNPPAGEKPIPSFGFTYESLLQFFDALQLAGPDLTPANFEAAMKLIPQSSPSGMYGGWNGKSGPYDPSSGYHVVRFDANAISALDGQKGAFIACDANKLFSYENAGSDVVAHKQLSCSKSEGIVHAKASYPVASANAGTR